MSCSGQVLARFAAGSRSFHLVAAAIRAPSRRDHPALLAPTYSAGFFVRDSFNHVSKLVRLIRHSQPTLYARRGRPYSRRARGRKLTEARCVIAF